MNTTPTDIDAESLAAALPGDGPITLSSQNAALVRSMLEQFAAEQVTLLNLQRRLERHEQSAERLDRALTSGLQLVASRLERPAADAGYDFAASKKIREDLVEQISRARRPDEIWLAAARTAVRLIALL